jgi:hypothetical protein
MPTWSKFTLIVLARSIYFLVAALILYWSNSSSSGFTAFLA